MRTRTSCEFKMLQNHNWGDSHYCLGKPSTEDPWELYRTKASGTSTLSVGVKAQWWATGKPAHGLDSVHGQSCLFPFILPLPKTCCSLHFYQRSGVQEDWSLDSRKAQPSLPEHYGYNIIVCMWLWPKYPENNFMEEWYSWAHSFQGFGTWVLGPLCLVHGCLALCAGAEHVGEWADHLIVGKK